MDKNKKLFPQKLWELIHNPSIQNCLRWSQDGQRVYLNRNEFEQYYLKTANNQFHTQKAISFVRQMNMYGFKKVDDCHYENDNFKRGCHHLIKRMVRRNSNRPHMTTTASFSEGAGQSMGSLFGHQHDVGGHGPGSHTGGNHNNSGFDQQHDGISSNTTAMSCSGRHHGLSAMTGGPALVDDNSQQQQHVTTTGNGGGGLDLGGQSNNLRALYEQLVSLNWINSNNTTARDSSLIQQLARSSSQLNNLIGCSNQTFADTTPTATTGPTTEAARIARSSLASSLYQGLALPGPRMAGSGGYLSCPLSATTTTLTTTTTTTSTTTTLSVPPSDIQYASSGGFNGSASSSSTSTSASPQSVRATLTAQSLVEAATRDARELMASVAAAAASSSHERPAARTLAAQQLLQQTLIGSLMQLRLAATQQLPNHNHQQGPTLTDSSISQNYQALNSLLGPNQHNLGSALLAQAQQQQQAHMLQDQNLFGTLTASNHVNSLDVPTSSECNPIPRSLIGGGVATGVSSYSSSSSCSSSSRNTCSASLSLPGHQSMSNEILEAPTDQCPQRHLPGCSGLNLSRNIRRATGTESNFECPLVTDEDDDDDYDAVRQGPPSRGSNSSENSTVQFGQQQQQQTRPAAPAAHCMSRRQLDGTLFNLASSSKERGNDVNST